MKRLALLFVLMAGTAQAADAPNDARASGATAPAFHFANAEDEALTARGATVYMGNCAGCHGRRLQGQALWQLRDQYLGRRAPPHDSTGHTWQHGDEELFTIVKTGKFSTTPKDIVSFMPAYDKRLSDDEILAVIAFIKSSWPIGMRASQSMLNPGFKGMPKDAGKIEWTLPPNCTSSFQRWGETSK